MAAAVMEEEEEMLMWQQSMQRGMWQWGSNVAAGVAEGTMARPRRRRVRGGTKMAADVVAVEKVHTLLVDGCFVAMSMGFWKFLKQKLTAKQILMHNGTFHN